MDTSLVTAYVNLSEYLYISNLDTIIPLCKKAVQIGEDALKKNYSLTTKKNLKISIAGALNNLGFINNRKGKVSEALKFYHQSLKIKEEIDDKFGMAATYNNIGVIHNTLDNLDLALKYFSKSVEQLSIIGEKKGIASTYNNMGYIYKVKKKNELSLSYYQKALEIRIEIDDKKGSGYSYNNIGTFYYEQGDIEKAKLNYQKAFKLYQEVDYSKGIVLSLCNLGRINIIDDNILGAKQKGLEALELSNKIGSPELIEKSASILRQVAQKQKDWLNAFEMHMLEIEMRDSLNNLSALKTSANLQAKYEYEKSKEIDDIQYEKNLALEKEKKEKQRIISIAITIVLGLLAIFLIIVLNRLKVTKKQKQVIQQQKEIVEEAHQDIKDSIVYAKRIQSAILPSNKVVKEYLQESFILYKPKDVVAGDFYWMEHKNGKVLFAAADCTGHGVPGAMVSVVCNNGLNRAVREHGLTDPGQILDKAREIVIQEFDKSEEDVKDGMDIALCSLEGKKLQYAGAHNPLWIIRNGELIETKANKQPIGKFEYPEPYITHSFDLEQGDSIYIFSDGYVDQFGGEKGKKFKVKAFRDLLLSIQDKSMEEQKTIINEAFETWRGSLEQIDDVCVIGVKI
ncbi:tetratricopeptide repeat protein [Vicingus serpentipes]|uniref:Tetratricopeptide repeat protein n=1 Tax=Vicingus serpentipes TaxID=1926625 RepID=A0A5C6RU62_9FLAO|nr:tetratricopeptide repeat protein [Vicingus serpentipes]TXB65841.1 tetratricopeptide repeat protein [Vicingus serpentipes]